MYTLLIPTTGYKFCLIASVSRSILREVGKETTINTYLAMCILKTLTVADNNIAVLIKQWHSTMYAVGSLWLIG